MVFKLFNWYRSQRKKFSSTKFSLQKKRRKPLITLSGGILRATLKDTCGTEASFWARSCGLTDSFWNHRDVCFSSDHPLASVEQKKLRSTQRHTQTHSTRNEEPRKFTGQNQTSLKQNRKRRIFFFKFFSGFENVFHSPYWISQPHA